MNSMACCWKALDPLGKSVLFIRRQLLAMVLSFMFQKASLHMVMNHASGHSCSSCCLMKVEKGAINKASKCIVLLLHCFGVGDASSMDFGHVMVRWVGWSIGWYRNLCRAAFILVWHWVELCSIYCNTGLNHVQPGVTLGQTKWRNSRTRDQP